MIKTLRDIFPKYPIAFSDHTPDADMDIAAITEGVNLVEKTITEDRTYKSVEHIFSLEGNQIEKFVKRVKQLEIALGDYNRHFSPEQINKTKLIRRSAHLKLAVKKGQEIVESNVLFMRPGIGVSCKKWFEEYNSKKIVAKFDLQQGQILNEEDLEIKNV